MNRKKIMLADDADLLLELEKTFFQRRQFDLVVARTGQQAIDLAISDRPDLIFMDLYLPELAGDIACSWLKQDASLSHIPVVLVTHAGKDEDLARCRAAGCDKVLFKPINQHQFMETARYFLQLPDRQVPRVRVNLPVRYGCEPQSLTSDNALNISEKGLFIATAKPFPVRQSLILEFALPDTMQSIRTQGVVVWQNRPGQPVHPGLPLGIGVEFVALGEGVLATLRDFIKQDGLAPFW